MQPVPKVQLLELPQPTTPSNARKHSPLIPLTIDDRKPDPLRIEEPRFLTPNICGIFSHGLLRSERCHAPEGDPPGGGGGGQGGGAGGDPPKTFTQDDVNRIVGQRVGEATKKFADYDSLKQAASEVPTLKQRLEELEADKAKQGKTAEEIQRMEADKAARQLQREREDANTKLTAAEKRALDAENALRTERTERALGAGLDGANVFAAAREDAVLLFSAASKVEFDDAGKVASVTYNAVAYKTAADAAKAFLKDRPHLASAGRPAGGGTTPPSGGGGMNGRPLYELSEDELLQRANQTNQHR